MQLRARTAISDCNIGIDFYPKLWHNVYMKTLEKYLDSCSAAYYAGNPIISDEVFDQLSENCGYNKVGAAARENVKPHLYQMYSLQKFYENEDKRRPLEGVADISVSTKLDGAAVSLLYIDGEFVRALTRGDGVAGQDITDKLLSTNSLVPHKVKNLAGVYQITGEIVAPKHIENARNYAAGALNLKDCEEFKTRALSFFAHGVYPNLSATYDGDMQILKKLGFSTVKETELDKVYPNDGLVFRANSNQQFRDLGYTSKHPRGAYALKTRADHVETKLLGVEWQVGKTGKVTPIAILEPVLIGDAMVSRATLNNPGFIEALGIEIGDTLAVIRAGEIIPCILHKVDV
jgi:NAD-dependent DNA ligase